jgi:hypothetical protein
MDGGAQSRQARQEALMAKSIKAVPKTVSHASRNVAAYTGGGVRTAGRAIVKPIGAGANARAEAVKLTRATGSITGVVVKRAGRDIAAALAPSSAVATSRANPATKRKVDEINAITGSGAKAVKRTTTKKKK